MVHLTRCEFVKYFARQGSDITQIVRIFPPAVKLWDQAELHLKGGGSQHSPGPDLPATWTLQGRHHRARERGRRGRAPAVRLAVVLHRASGRRRDRDGGEDGVGTRPRCCQQHREVGRGKKTTIFKLCLIQKIVTPGR